jgi:phosphoribosyl 1,2-cyclic phosphate phosphodiesterase
MYNALHTIKITFLGTGTSAGVPMVGCNCKVCTSTDSKDKRLRSSILVQSRTTTVVIDTTPDFRYQMLRAGIQKLDAAIFTHPHKDHIGGLDDIRAFNFVQQKTMPLYVNALTKKGIMHDFHYAFSGDDYPGIPQLKFYDIDNEVFRIGDIEFMPIQLWHHKMPVLGFRIKGFVYITDANRIETIELEKCMRADYFTINMLRKEAHVAHFTMADAITLAQQCQAKKILGTHISHQLGKHTEVSYELPSNSSLAYDSLEIFL